VTDTKLQQEVNWLAIAFLMAGARSVIGTQWEVNDAYTPRFMATMYQHITSLAAASCLRQAMLAAIREGVHPYVWAPFMLMGEAGPVETQVTRFSPHP
jgi:CHAT domain-containing protein